METKELLKKVRKIEIKTRRLSNHVFGGEYHSAFKGRGMTFSEIRRYQYGDDVRNIDWNVTARYNEPFIKVFEEERELTLMLAVDISGSQFFGVDTKFKNEIITEIAATLAFSATQNNDKVGLVLFSDQIELFIAPKKGRSHVLRIIRELVEFKPQSQQTDLSKTVKFLQNMLKKSAIIFVLSDFMTDEYERALKILGNKHDVTGIRIYDKRETVMPNLGMIQMQDAETGELMLVNTGSASVRKNYAAHYLERVDYFKKAFQRSKAGTMSLQTGQDYVKKLLGYFKRR
ncbi:MAG TPA: DUF58 domain-containing protein [Flavobacteriaceae bacterium]|nr:DUF58 domain-containing protein [Flavobacteriaceae bacterium]